MTTGWTGYTNYRKGRRPVNDNLPPSARGRICIDFDGTLFPWGEQHNDEPAFPYAAEVVTRIRDAGYEIVIFTSRMSPTWWLAEGWNLKEAMQRELKYVQDRLEKHGIPYDRITCEKVPAAAYIDDKAITFSETQGWAELEAKELAWMTQ